MLTSTAALLGMQMSAQLVDAFSIPNAEHIPTLLHRISTDGPALGLKQLSRRNATSYLPAGFDGNPNTTINNLPLSTDNEFSFILQVAMSMANGGGASTGEVLRVASQLIPGDFDSWFNEFYFMAEQIHAQAVAAKTVTSARSAYFRASTYYRMSSFFLIGNASDPRLYGPWQQALDDFDKAISLMDVPGIPFNVSGPGYSVPGYFWKSPVAAKCNSSVPTVIIGSGYDAPQQDSFHAIGHEILNQGWNLVTYEGGGQATTRRQQGVGFTPSWWEIVTPVIDYLANLPSVDMDNLALQGISFGGILAPLAASKDYRLKAVMSIDGLVNFETVILDNLGTPLSAAFNTSNATLFDAKVAELYPTESTQIKWFLNQGRWSFATESAFDFVNQTGSYVLTPDIIANITAHGWVGKGENDTLAGGQEDTLEGYYNSSGRPAFLQYFPMNAGSGLHSQTGAEQQLAEATTDWLSTIFSNYYTSC